MLDCDMVVARAGRIGINDENAIRGIVAEHYPRLLSDLGVGFWCIELERFVDNPHDYASKGYKFELRELRDEKK